MTPVLLFLSAEGITFSLESSMFKIILILLVAGLCLYAGISFVHSTQQTMNVMTTYSAQAFTK